MEYTELTMFERAYVEAMVWSSTDDDAIPFDDSKYTDTDFASETLITIQLDCSRFIVRLENLTVEPSAQIAHDFWLTRNRHGAGFWDGDYPEPLGTQLTDIAHSFGEQTLYVGDDGKFYLM